MLHVVQNCCLLCLELAFTITDVVQGILVIAPMLEVFAEVMSFKLGLFLGASLKFLNLNQQTNDYN
jgi:hypothetical protein